MKTAMISSAYFISAILHVVRCANSFSDGTRHLSLQQKQTREDYEYDGNCKILISHGGNDLVDYTLIQNWRPRPREITIAIYAFGEKFTLDLQLNTYLFGSTYVEKSITKSGVVYHTVNHTADNCFYIGVVRNKASSTAAASTCKGIVGYFTVGSTSYHVEPRHDQGQKIVVYRYRDKECNDMRCRRKDKTSRVRRSFIWPQNRDKINRVLEIYFANDNSQFVNKGSDVKAVFQRSKDIANVASLLFQPLDIYLVVVGVEVWTDTDDINVVNSDVSSTFNSWCDYRMRNINPLHYNDEGILLTNVQFNPGGVGHSSFGQMCSNRYSGSIVSDVRTSAASTGATLARQIGHSFGVLDDFANCSCNDPTGVCIMNPASYARSSTAWSSCSTNQLTTAFQQGHDICLYNVPQTIFDSTVSTCGNGIVEDGEECDCGKAPENECNSACCNPTTCKLTASATCSFGRCCDVSKCQILPVGSVCRPKSGDCDLPEGCDGIQALCPPDTYKPDGTNCTVNSVNSDFAYCYSGQCRSQRSQCELLWGVGTLASDPVCYYMLNIRGIESGNCGLSWLPSVTFIPCLRSDSMCGRLQCQNNSTMLHMYSVENTIVMIQTSISGRVCNSVTFDYGLNTQDPGLVPNGAICGDGQMCVNQGCVNISNLATVPCAGACYPNEVCNNVGQCQKLDLFGSSSTRRPGNAAVGRAVVNIDFFIIYLIGLIFSTRTCPVLFPVL